jgi:AraC-like DNA-binding protein
MIVLGLLEAPAGRLFQDALSRTATLLVSNSGDEFASLLLRRSVDAAVIDPAAGIEDVVPDGPYPAAIALARAPHVPFLLCFTKPTRSFAHTQSLLKLTPTGILHVRETEPHLIRSAVRALTDRSLPRRILSHIAQRMESLAPEMQRVIWQVFEEPDVHETVDDLRKAAGMSRRDFDRQLLRAGLAAALTFLRVGRLGTAYARLHGTGATCDEVVREMQYSSGRRLSSDSHAVLGIPPTAMRRLGVDEFAARLGAALVRERRKVSGPPRRDKRTMVCGKWSYFPAPDRNAASARLIRIGVHRKPNTRAPGEPARMSGSPYWRCTPLTVTIGRSFRQPSAARRPPADTLIGGA